MGIAEGSGQLIKVTPAPFPFPTPPRLNYRDARMGVSLTRTSTPLFINKGGRPILLKGKAKDLNENQKKSVPGRTKTELGLKEGKKLESRER